MPCPVEVQIPCQASGCHPDRLPGGLEARDHARARGWKRSASRVGEPPRWWWKITPIISDG